MKPTVFLDFDDSLFETRGPFIDFLNQFYGINLPKERSLLCGNSLPEIVSEHLPDGQSISYEDFYVQVGINFIQSAEWHKDVYPMIGSEEVIPSIAEKYDLWIVTARQTEGEAVIRSLLEKYFPNFFDGIHCVWTHIGNGEFSGKPKRDFVSEFKGQKVAFVDDNPGEIRNMQSLIPSYLFDPHGQHSHHTDIPKRVKSWEQIASVLL